MCVSWDDFVSTCRVTFLSRFGKPHDPNNHLWAKHAQMHFYFQKWTLQSNLFRTPRRPIKNTILRDIGKWAQTDLNRTPVCQFFVQISRTIIISQGRVDIKTCHIMACYYSDIIWDGPNIPATQKDSCYASVPWNLLEKVTLKSIQNIDSWVSQKLSKLP